MIAVRRVEPEWLDELPAEDPRAIRSRRDLARVNVLMANAKLIARELPAGLASIAEIGAGDGAFALRLAKVLPRALPGAAFTLLDRQAIVARTTGDALRQQGWACQPVQADVFDWLGDRATPRFDAIVANLFLHHFEPARLARLLALVAERTRCFVACEPRRSRIALVGSSLLGVIGCNDVTRHDAVVSVRAGFRDGELASLWPREGWEILERGRGLFSHVLAARRP